MFIILSLSQKLKYNEDLNIREESDLLGITLAVGNTTFVMILFLVYRLYLAIVTDPNILNGFL